MFLKKLKNRKKITSYLIRVINLERMEFSGYENYESIFFNIDWSLKQFEEFEKINIPEKMMINGLVFIWSDIYLLDKIINKMDSMKFKYVENLVVVSLNKNKLLNILEEKKLDKEYIYKNNNFDFINLDLLEKKNYEFFNKSKKTLLIFRRKLVKDSNLELRHQRNPDSLFDISERENENNISDRGMEKVYSTIETMLPKACETNNFGFLQIFGSECKRNNWLTLNKKKI